MGGAGEELFLPPPRPWPTEGRFHSPCPVQASAGLTCGDCRACEELRRGVEAGEQRVAELEAAGQRRETETREALEGIGAERDALQVALREAQEALEGGTL